ncbi:cell division suppressor protein YneA [Halanaerobium praevalens]|uniref:Peptidoglycan-binding lysin domain protein n=1 Tax=Halanaerobium praevalens (strain ATCC 33744 / DSM 2228 / GSL) TaxID=572479 RepID=E3DLE5_HALPG|nr:LysM peptidoglycan-binding domain-containing protein [Halanaerobium praevalens]ADO77184.1 Peptidoglycan-binding lysin domain protein [Halanaerobium praevalens DSM 2228]
MNNLNVYSLNYSQNKRTKNKDQTILIKFLTILTVIICLSILFILLFSLLGKGKTSDNFIKHEIKVGESLWSIANHYYDSNKVDLRKIVYNIKEINNINSSLIIPGKKLLVPLN